MILAEEFLQLKTYAEYDKNREKFRELKKEGVILKHMSDLFGTGYAPKDMHQDLLIEDEIENS